MVSAVGWSVRVARKALIHSLCLLLFRFAIYFFSFRKCTCPTQKLLYNIEEKLLRSGGRSYTIIITVTDINRVAQEKLFVNAFLFAAEKKHPMYYSVKICYTDSRKVDLFGTFAPGF